ncbi:MAG: N-acetylglucosamine kinase [Proteobacteria bacterium]|nr:N-acetylglucosamine kinase [Pseudomonadota bacterium]
MFLGVDGGGTKTALALIDRDGAIRGMHAAPGTYYFASGLDATAAVLVAAVAAVLANAGAAASDIEFAYFGLPGYGEDSTLGDALDRLPAASVAGIPFRCGNDMVCGWAGSLMCRDGINVVAGTGSICYGERAGRTARCGGWGELFSDEGSAYWIACRGLNLFTRMSDGRAPRGPLHDLMRSSLGLAADLDVCGHVYTRLAGDRARIAQIARLVQEAARAGDAQAVAVYDEAGLELARLVEATRRQLGFGADETVLVSYSGGVFDHAGELLLRPFVAALRAHHPHYRLEIPALPPVLGAALYAARCAGKPLDAAAIARLRSQAAVSSTSGGATAVASA